MYKIIDLSFLAYMFFLFFFNVGLTGKQQILGFHPYDKTAKLIHGHYIVAAEFKRGQDESILIL